MYGIEGNSEEVKAKLIELPIGLIGAKVVSKVIEKTGAKVEAKLLKGSGKAEKIYNAAGDPALRATRRPIFDKWVQDGIEVNGQNFKMNQHAENSLFKSGRKDIMPDDITDALKTTPKPANPGSVEYVNPATGTSVFVNPTTKEIVGVWPNNFIK